MRTTKLTKKEKEIVYRAAEGVLEGEPFSCISLRRAGARRGLINNYLNFYGFPNSEVRTSLFFQYTDYEECLYKHRHQVRALLLCMFAHCQGRL